MVGIGSGGAGGNIGIVGNGGIPGIWIGGGNENWGKGRKGIFGKGGKGIFEKGGTSFISPNSLVFDSIFSSFAFPLPRFPFPWLNFSSWRPSLGVIKLVMTTIKLNVKMRFKTTVKDLWKAMP